jgi:hypothetical protein
LSDGQGVYEGDNVYIRDNGNLFFDVRDDIPRMFCFDFGDQGYDPQTSCDDGYMTTKDASIAGAMQIMPVGSQMTTRALVYWSVPLGDNPARTSPRFLRYGVDCDLLEVAQNKLLVTHPYENTWILEGNNAILCQGSTTLGKPVELPPLDVSMPIKLTLVRLEP